VTILRRGARDLPRTAVRASQRRRLLDAMTAVIATRGYANASVADAIAAAGVSRKTFYELYRDKEDCFLAASAAIGTRLLHAIIAAGDGATAGPARRRAQLECFLDGLARDPLAARVYLVDALAVPKARRARHRMDARIVEAFLGDVSDRVLRAAIAGGINAAVVEDFLLARGRARPDRLLDPLVAFVERALAT
jgi:AcrR family transcriptional regulator